MQDKALVVIDIQNDITKNYKEIIGNINAAVERAVAKDMHVVSDNIFIKSKGNALTSEGFAAFIEVHGIKEFYVAGADAVACVKTTCYNMAKSGYAVHVLSDCITSYDKRKIPEMLDYYERVGCRVESLASF